MDVAFCRSCHPTADMHGVDIVPETVKPHEGWPLLEGKVVCVTCHADPACGTGRMSEAPYWRGGPVTRIQDFCYRCHDREEYRRKDPHHDEDPAGCAACHTANEGELRVAVGKLCAECHVGTTLPSGEAGFIHAGVAEHMGKKPTGELPKEITLVDGAVGCVSCHDVHGGAVPSDKPASGLGAALRDRALASDWSGKVPEGARWPGDPVTGHLPMLALTVEDGALCRACHGDGP
jgi:hypothetical protein